MLDIRELTELIRELFFRIASAHGVRFKSGSTSKKVLSFLDQFPPNIPRARAMSDAKLISKLANLLDTGVSGEHTVPDVGFVIDRSVITGHAVERFQEHHPGSTAEDVGVWMCRSEEIPKETAIAYLGRPKDRPYRKERFFLSQDKRGIFLVEDNVVITYLRLSEKIQEILRGVAE